VETRVGLGPLVVGLLKALAELVYAITDITITQTKSRDPAQNQHHDEFHVVWLEDGDTADDTSDGEGETESSAGLAVRESLHSA
jgi:hypothetical protein